MDAGSLIVLLLVGVGLFAMFAMHRGGGHSHGAGGGCGGGHGHAHGPSPEQPREEQEPLLGPPGHEPERKPAVADGKHRGC